MKGNYSFRRFSCNRELLIQDSCSWHSYRESTFELRLRKTVLLTADLKVLGKS